MCNTTNRTVVRNLQVLHMHSGIMQSDCAAWLWVRSMLWAHMCLTPLRFFTWCLPPMWLLLLTHGINPDVQHYKSDRFPQLASPTYPFHYHAILLRKHGWGSEKCYWYACGTYHPNLPHGVCRMHIYRPDSIDFASITIHILHHHSCWYQLFNAKDQRVSIESGYIWGCNYTDPTRTASHACCSEGFTTIASTVADCIPFKKACMVSWRSGVPWW
jgi:hypothetical protein